MGYLPAAGPVPNHDDLPFWESCRNRELRFQRCTGCGRFRHPPVPACQACQSMAFGWEPAGTAGVLFSYTVVHHPVSEAMKAHVPYNVAIVAFPNCGGVRLVSNVIDVAPDGLRLGMPLELVWEAADNGWLLPRFRSGT